MPSKKACILNNGCPENRIDSARLEIYLQEDGWSLSDSYREADLIFFNACALTQCLEEHSFNIINHVKATKKESARLIVFGCLPKINEKRLREVYLGEFFNSDELERVKKIIGSEKDIDSIHANRLSSYVSRGTISNFNKKFDFSYLLESLLEPIQARLNQATEVFDSYTFSIKVATGCQGNCSFCAVKLSRGQLRSKPLDAVVREFDEGLEKGYRDFGFLGTNVGQYGWDKGITLADLLEEILKRKGDYRIRLRNIDPRFLINNLPRICRLFASGRITHFSSPVQSGSNRILSLMNRGYAAEDYKRIVGTINKEFPNIQVRTQILVAFPSETEEDFLQSARLLDELVFDFVEVYPFQPRPNTKAAELPGHIASDIAHARYYRLRKKILFNRIPRKLKNLGHYLIKKSIWKLKKTPP